MTEKLMPCPFCGCDAFLSAGHMTVGCSSCGAEMYNGRDGEGDCVAAWNTRHPIPAADEVEGRLRRYLYEREKMKALDQVSIHGMHIGTDRQCELLVSDIEAAIAALQARSAEPAEDWEATHRYCVKQWEREREEMMRKVVDLRAQLGLRADGTPAEPAGEEPVAWLYEMPGDPKHVEVHTDRDEDLNYTKFTETPLYRRPATPSNPSFAITAEELGQIMQDEWGDICEDAQAHPEDIRREGRKLFYLPRHWTAAIADRLNARRPEPATPTNPERLVELARTYFAAKDVLDARVNGHANYGDLGSAASLIDAERELRASLSAAPLKDPE